MEKEPITVIGLEKLKTELVFLKEKKRPEIVAAISEARSHGDLKENAEYHAAKEQQGLTEAKINELEHALANAQVIDVRELPKTGKVVFGATIQLYNLDTDESISYQIVGNLESDPANGMISIDTPIGRGLIGKSIGDEVSIETPSGKLNFEIEEVEHI